ncbi:MAG: hypothetical protein VB012_02490 [Erysipelotrichaceae bacterium]|nr:hypothetical protein [Erysipelotrichaceae bacterium]
MLKKVIVLLISITLCAFSVSIVLRCAIGVGAWDAFSQSASGLLSIKVGTFSMLMNIACVIGQILMRRAIKLVLLLQIALAVLLGTMVNYFYYEVFQNWQLNSYIVTVILFLIGNVLCAFAVGTVIAQGILSFPLEGICMEIALKVQKPFGRIRQLADVITIIAVLILVTVFNGMMTIREGTIVGMIIFGPLLDLYMAHIKPWMIRRRIFTAT